MTDKELVLWTLEKIKWRDGHSNINSLWNVHSVMRIEHGWDYPEYIPPDTISDDQKQRVRIILEEDGLATQHLHGYWDMMITTRGFKIKPNHISEDGRYRFIPKDLQTARDRKNQVFGAGLTLITGLIIAVTSVFLTRNCSSEQSTKSVIVLPLNDSLDLGKHYMPIDTIHCIP